MIARETEAANDFHRSTASLVGDSLSALGGVIAVVLLVFDMPQDQAYFAAQGAVLLWLGGLTLSIADRLEIGHRATFRADQ